MRSTGQAKALSCACNKIAHTCEDSSR